MDNALKKSIDNLYNLAIKEDEVKNDITSKLTVTNKKIEASLIFKENGVLSGTDVIKYIINKFNKQISIKWKYKNGQNIKKNSTVATIKGPGNHILSIERIILNFLQRLCGISTLTYTFSKELKKSKIKILDTRKTVPGWRHLEKYAVKIGGGFNHRKNLKDLLLIKENHIFLNNTIQRILENLKKKNKLKATEIEVSSIKELKEVIQYHPKRIMLDNFSIANIKKSVEIIKSNTKCEIEVSGNMTVKKIKKLKNMNLDYISVGKITHSATFLDISMIVVK